MLDSEALDCIVDLGDAGDVATMTKGMSDGDYDDGGMQTQHKYKFKRESDDQPSVGTQSESRSGTGTTAGSRPTPGAPAGRRSSPGAPAGRRSSRRR